MKQIKKIVAISVLISALEMCASDDALSHDLSAKQHHVQDMQRKSIVSSASQAAQASHALTEHMHGNDSTSHQKVDVSEKVSSALTQEFIGEAESVVFNFEDVDLKSVAQYMERVHRVKFVTEDIIATNKQAKGFGGHKISFRTNSPLTKQESWNLFLTFLNMAALDIVPMAQAGYYRVVPLPSAPQEPIPTYIGVSALALPDNDMVIRYIYFMKNLDPTKIQQLISKLQGQGGTVTVYGELKALIFTDKAYNIKSLMKIVAELDRVTMPQVMSVIKLNRTNVSDVIKLYNSLRPSNASQPQRAWAPTHKISSLEYFPQDVVLAGDERTNTLIVLGSKDAVSRIEEFVTKHVDIDLDNQVQPIYTYYLEYTNATDIQKMLTGLVQYGNSTPAGKYGGVRDGYKYLQQMTIVADPHSNSLIINAAEDDYKVVERLIKKLDVPQKQIALEVLLVQVKDTDTKQLGSQISGPNNTNTFLKNVSAQTSGIPPGTGIVSQAGGSGDINHTIKTTLASLLSGTIGAAGSTLVTFGQPIWAVFKILKSIASTKIIANPFGVATNNSQLKMSMGAQRRVITGTVYSSGSNQASGYSDAQASLEISITPQVNDEGIVNLQIDIQNNQFVNSDLSDAVQDKKSLTTSASVANGEVLVLGGIMVDNLEGSKSGVPLLSKIPVLGWMFKSKSKKVSRETFVVFICPKVLDDSQYHKGYKEYTETKMEETREYMKLLERAEEEDNKRDPINRAFFGQDKTYNSNHLMNEGEIRTSELVARDSSSKMKVSKKSKKTRKTKRLEKQALKNKHKKRSKRKKIVKNKSHAKKNDVGIEVIHIPKHKAPERETNRITNTIRNNPGVYYYD